MSNSPIKRYCAGERKVVRCRKADKAFLVGHFNELPLKAGHVLLLHYLDSQGKLLLIIGNSHYDLSIGALTALAERGVVGLSHKLLQVLLLLRH